MENNIPLWVFFARTQFLMFDFQLLQKFVREFLEQNPISQLGIIVTRNKRAEKISDLSGNSRKHLSNLEQCSNHTYCLGEPSLQNALELALSSMKMLPSHTSREILVIFGSLTTCDPGSIKETIEVGWQRNQLASKWFEVFRSYEFVRSVSDVENVWSQNFCDWPVCRRLCS